MAERRGPSSCAVIQLGSGEVYASEGGSFSQFGRTEVRGIEVRLIVAPPPVMP